VAIATLDDLVRAMASGTYRLPVYINSSSSQITGQFSSRWRHTAFPPTGAIPTSAAVCNAATVGAMPLAPRTGAQQRVIAQTSLTSSAAGQTLIIEDRLMHMGGLSGNLITAQTKYIQHPFNADTDPAHLIESGLEMFPVDDIAAQTDFTIDFAGITGDGIIINKVKSK
jgi:hypothetical protein